MDKDAAFKALAQKLIDQKVETYRKKVEEEFELLKKRVATHTPHTLSEANDKSVTVPHELIAKEEFAPLLEHFLANKQINPSFSWREEYYRTMMPCSSRYTLLGVALQSKAIANARVLVEHGANVNEYCNDLNRSYTTIIWPLEEAVRLNDPSLVRAILEKKPNYLSSSCVASMPLSIALATICSTQVGKERDNAWNIIQALTKAGANYLEKSSSPYDAHVVDIGDSVRQYRIVANTPLDIIQTYNHHFNNKLAYVETYLTGRSQPQGRGSVSYVQDKP